MAKHFRYKIERGETNRTWVWEILTPKGEPLAWGARRSTKAETEAMLKKTCKRLDGNVGWAPQNISIEAAKAYRERGARRMSS